MPLHPIIENYINSNIPPLEVFEKHVNKHQLLEKNLLLIAKAFSSEKIDDNALKAIDEAIIAGHPDQNVYLLFLYHAIAYTYRHHLHEQLKSLYSLIESTNNTHTPPFLQVLCMQAHAHVSGAEGDFVKMKKLMKQSMDILKYKPLRYLQPLRNYSAHLAHEGLLRDLTTSDLESLNLITTEIQAKDFFHIKLANSVYTCNTQEANQLIEGFKKSFPDSNFPPIKDALTMLSIVSGNLNEEKHPDGIKMLVREIKAMIAGQYTEAINYHDWIKKNIITGHHVIINDYFPLHIELSLGNRGKAQLILFEKTQKSGHHYLDDLFYGRLQLLNKEYEKADQTFQLLIKNVTHYGAMNRLIYELQFSREMSLPDVLRLSQGWKNYTPPSSDKRKKELVERITPNLSGVNLLIGSSPAITQIREQVKKYASIKSPILITGQTGTGKELVAKAIHDEGLFFKEPFLAINCGALTDTLLQSDLFGYVAGAFTGAQKERKGIFESVGKGTVFLDEFGEISHKLQVSLLRVLESNEIRLLGGTENRKIECKIVIATNTNLKQAVAAKEFREDLYFRLTRFEIKLPPLHERAEDVPELIQHFLDINQKDNEERKTVSEELKTALSNYHWPGNIRELKNEIDRFYILNPDKTLLEKADFDFTRLAESPKLKDEPTHTVKPTVKPDKPFLQPIKEKNFTTEQRLTHIKELFLQHKKLTRNQIMTATKVSPSTATKDLKTLCDAGFIIKKSPTSSPRTDYFETPENHDTNQI